MRSVNRNYAINTVTRDEAEMIAEYRRAKEDEKDAYYARLAEQGLLGTEPLSFGQELLRAIDSLEMGFALLFVCGVSAVILGAVFAGESALISSLALSGPILLFIALVGFKDKIFTLFGWKIKYTRAEMEHDDFNHTFGV